MFYLELVVELNNGKGLTRLAANLVYAFPPVPTLPILCQFNLIWVRDLVN